MGERKSLSWTIHKQVGFALAGMFFLTDSRRLSFSVYGEYRFSALEVPPPDKSSQSGGRLTGLDMCNYMENFSTTFLKDKAKFIFGTEVLNVERTTQGGWSVEVKDLESNVRRTLSFSRIILASGVGSLLVSTDYRRLKQSTYLRVAVTHMSQTHYPRTRLTRRDSKV